MAEVNFVATMACIEATRHSEFVIEFFKIIKNGKPITLKLFVETIIDPSKLTDSEISEFMKSFHNSFFKTNMNLDLKQIITGFLIRMRCSNSFCSKVTNLPLKHFVISPAMNQLYQFLIEFFKPVILKITTSKKSHSGSQIKNFTNISSDQFELIRGEKLVLNRKMAKFEVWSVKSEHMEWINNVINDLSSENITNDHQVLDYSVNTDNITVFTVNENNDDNNIAQYFSTFMANY